MQPFPLRFACILFLQLVIAIPGICQVIDLVRYRTPFQVKGIEIYRITAGPAFTEKQNIVIAKLNREYLAKFRLDIAFSDTVLKATSMFASEANAIVALNGSFFDVTKGGSVAYLESDGQVKARNRSSKEKWGKTDSLLNGAIIIDYSGKLIIEQAKSETSYENSNSEKTVLVSGPLLLINRQKVLLENSAFVLKRHPRSCLCETDDQSILLVAIDGRNENAAGMNLAEASQFLLSLGCRNAINLDGGGSTTLWANDGTTAGILNHPSDKEGERPVSNCIVIKE